MFRVPCNSDILSDGIFTGKAQWKGMMIKVVHRFVDLNVSITTWAPSHLSLDQLYKNKHEQLMFGENLSCFIYYLNQKIRYEVKQN